MSRGQPAGEPSAADYWVVNGLLSSVRCAVPGARYDRAMVTPEIARFWADARAALPHLPEAPPEAWAFGATTEHADGLLGLVLEGVKTATASALEDYEADGEPVPAVGDLSIILDGGGAPRAVLEVTGIDIIPFDQVSDEHAHAEGEDDRTLATWRRIHERFWREFATTDFRPDMPVVCERFRVVHPAAD